MQDLDMEEWVGVIHLIQNAKLWQSLTKDMGALHQRKQNQANNEENATGKFRLAGSGHIVYFTSFCRMLFEQITKKCIVLKLKKKIKLSLQLQG